jgi:hypothetical protein
MENVMYDTIFYDYPLCTERILELGSSYYRGSFVCLLVFSLFTDTG